MIKQLLFLIPTAALAGEPTEDRYLNIVEVTDRYVAQRSEAEIQLAARCYYQAFFAAELLKQEPNDINVDVNKKVHDGCNEIADTSMARYKAKEEEDLTTPITPPL